VLWEQGSVGKVFNWILKIIFIGKISIPIYSLVVEKCPPTIVYIALGFEDELFHFNLELA